MKRFTALLIAVALIAGTVGCPAEPGPDPDPPVRYQLTIASTEGGSVTTPGEGTFTYEAGTVVDLAAETEEGYRFDGWTGDVGTIADPNTATTTITMNDDYEIRANFVAQYVLTIGSTHGGEVIMPGEGAFTYDADTVVPLVAEAEDGYRFVKWMGDVSTVVYSTSAFATIAMNDDYSVTAEFEELDPQKLFAGGSGTEGNPYRIADWYHLNNVQYFLGAHYKLMNDLDSTTPGYAELASTTANHGKGWQPIGSLFVDPFMFEIVAPVDPFAGSFDGQGHEIRGLFINRPDESLVGLFADVDQRGVVESVGVVDAMVTGHVYVGCLVGYNWGAVRNSHSSGSLIGTSDHSGGLVGRNAHEGIVSNSYSIGRVTGKHQVGGLVGWNDGTVSRCYTAGRVTGQGNVGGLVGYNFHTVSNSYYNYDDVLINGHNMITIGAMFGDDFEQWLANDKFLDVNERLPQEHGYHVINDASDFKQLLAFGQDGSLRFRLKNDLDLADEPNLFIPYLAGEFHGNGHKISSLSFNFDFVCHVGLFGYLACGGEVTEVTVVNVNMAGRDSVSGLVGSNKGTISDSSSRGRVAGVYEVGGLVGRNDGTVSNSYYTGSVTGSGWVAGMVGNNRGTVSNSYYNYDEVLINGDNMITIGALFSDDFEQWLANNKFLDVNERLSQEHGYYVIYDVSDLGQLLAFGQDESLRFQLKNDLDLTGYPNFYIPYLAAEFDGNGSVISNLSFDFDFVCHIGLFGYLAPGGKVTKIGVANASMAGTQFVGGLVGYNDFGTVSDSYSAGSVTGGSDVGGLVGENSLGTVSNSYSTGRVTADWGNTGGLVGSNSGTVSSSYSTASVTGEFPIGGLVAYSRGTVRSSFWDIETSGQSTSVGGTGKTTGEMQDIATFALWDIVAVASGETNTAYIWNIVEGQTYPFLSWQSVS